MKEDFMRDYTVGVAWRLDAYGDLFKSPPRAKLTLQPWKDFCPIDIFLTGRLNKILEQKANS
jgi:hypothetical protein